MRDRIPSGPGRLQRLRQGALQVAAGRAAAGGVERAQALAQLVVADRASAEERVEEHGRRCPDDAHQEVAGEADAFERDADARADLEQQRPRA